MKGERTFGLLMRGGQPQRAQRRGGAVAMGLRTFGVQMIGDSDRFPQAFHADARVSSIPIPIPTPTPMRGKPPAEGATATSNSREALRI